MSASAAHAFASSSPSPVSPGVLPSVPHSFEKIYHALVPAGEDLARSPSPSFSASAAGGGTMGAAAGFTSVDLALMPGHAGRKARQELRAACANGSRSGKQAGAEVGEDSGKDAAIRARPKTSTDSFRKMMFLDTVMKSVECVPGPGAYATSPSSTHADGSGFPRWHPTTASSSTLDVIVNRAKLLPGPCKLSSLCVIVLVVTRCT